jgi:hypothetical protein
MPQEANPPRWAERILDLLLKPADRETVSGDLLEEYRDAKLPALGLRRARVWYVRRVLGYFWRVAWPCVLLLSAIHIARDLFNTFQNVDASTNGRMEQAFTVTVFPALFLIGVYGGRKTGRVGGGIAVACGAQAAAWFILILWTTATFYPFVQSMRTNPYWIAAWHYRPTEQTFERWLIGDNIGGFVLGGSAMTGASLVLGAIGGAIGRAIRPPTRGAARAS